MSQSVMMLVVMRLTANGTVYVGREPMRAQGKRMRVREVSPERSGSMTMCKHGAYERPRIDLPK